MKLIKIVVATISLISVVGCGDIFDADSNSSDDLGPVQKFFVSRAQIICEKNEQCCAEVSVYFTSVDSCVGGAPSERYGSWVQDGVDAEEISFDEKRAYQCLDILETLNCTQWKALIEGTSIVECERIFIGNQKNGEYCNNDEACSSTHCAPEPENESPEYELGICAERKDEGEECFETSSISHDCIFGASCRSASIWITETCTPLMKEGENCMDDADCFGQRCDDEIGTCSPTCLLSPGDRTRNVLRHW